MARRRPAPAVHPKDPVLAPLKGFLDWVREQIDGALGSVHETLDDAINSHAARHVRGGADQIDGDTLDIDFTPTNYTRTTVSGLTTSTEEATSHLRGIDVKFGDLNSHAARHVRGGADQIDGDVIDIDFSPSNYTRTTVGGVTTNAEELTSHLKGIDDALAVSSPKITTCSGAYIFSSTITVTSYAPANDHRPAAAPITAIAQAQVGIGRAGTIRNLRARVLTATADADTFTVALNVNGTTTALVTPTTQGTSTAWVANTSDDVSVSVGDLYCIEITPVSGQQSGFTLLWTYDFEDAA
jgi:hypothetical protein